MFLRIARNVAAITVLALSPALANDVMPLPPDATPDEVAAYGVLDKHCARCHQDGALKPGLTSPKSGFGHILDIRRLAQDTKFVVQGNVMGSKVHNVIGEWSYPAMPDDCLDSSCYPTQAEMDIIAHWIETLGNTAPPPRHFVSMTEEFALAHADLQAQPTNRRDRVRYLSLRAMNNDPDVSNENLEGYRAATVKLVNALSWNPRPFRAEPVDAHGVLIRIFLPDVDWTTDTWHLLESHYPYGVAGSTDASLSQLQYMAGTEAPIIRADWFAATASVSPMYYDVLGLPDTTGELYELLRFDPDRNIQDEQVVRAGFQNSGVSTHNRLIERHPMGTGFFWTSYDFAGSVGHQSFFEYPLGPVSAFPHSSLAFRHDGGESIFTLPNGFHAYYLNTSDGKRINVGPTTIVRDDDYTDGTGEVVNGISCMSCHSKGIRLNDDRVRDVALGNLSISPAERQIIDAIYPGQEVVGDWMKRDTESFAAALESAGIKPETTAGGLEPVRGLFVYHVDAFVDFAQAANELGLTVDELRARAGFIGPNMASLLQRLDQSPIARDEWTAAYPVVLERVTDYRPIVVQYNKPANLSYSVANAIGYTPDPKPGDPNYKPAQDPNYKPAADPIYKPAADPNYNPAQDPNYKPAQDPTYNPNHVATYDPAKDPNYNPAHQTGYDQNQPAFDPTDHSVISHSTLTVYTDQPTYKVGEGMKIFVEPRDDCRLTLINIDDHGRSCVLYPHPQLADEVVKAGTRYTFPPRGSLTTSEVGVETILAICNAAPEAIAAETRDTSKVSCDPGQRTVGYESITNKNVINEVLTLDLSSDEKPAPNGATYRGLSSQNPYVAKAQISAPVTAY